MHRYRLPATSASYPPPLPESTAEEIFDGDAELESANDGENVPYAHRDIKPGLVLLPSTDD